MLIWLWISQNNRFSPFSRRLRTSFNSSWFLREQLLWVHNDNVLRRLLRFTLIFILGQMESILYQHRLLVYMLGDGSLSSTRFCSSLFAIKNQFKRNVGDLGCLLYKLLLLSNFVLSPFCTLTFLVPLNAWWGKIYLIPVNVKVSIF